MLMDQQHVGTLPTGGPCSQWAGFSYVEVLVATLLIAISLAPATDAIRTALAGSVMHRDALEEHYHLQGRLDEVLAQPTNVLEAEALQIGSPAVASSYSDLPNTNRRRLVYLSLYDADNLDMDNDPFTGMDPGLIWVKVELEATSFALESLVSRTP